MSRIPFWKHQHWTTILSFLSSFKPPCFEFSLTHFYRSFISSTNASLELFFVFRKMCCVANSSSHNALVCVRACCNKETQRKERCRLRLPRSLHNVSCSRYTCPQRIHHQTSSGYRQKYEFSQARNKPSRTNQPLPCTYTSPATRRQRFPTTFNTQKICPSASPARAPNPTAPPATASTRHPSAQPARALALVIAPADTAHPHGVEMTNALSPARPALSIATRIHTHVVPAPATTSGSTKPPRIENGRPAAARSRKTTAKLTSAV